MEKKELEDSLKSISEACDEAENLLDALDINDKQERSDIQNEELKKLLKSKEISEDEENSNEKNIQTITDNHIKIVDEKVSSKEKEIMTI